jgi:3-Oxoacyl-[acyl-carrier-protein (ACP)] synthase III C terminal
MRMQTNTGTRTQSRIHVALVFADHHVQAHTRQWHLEFPIVGEYSNGAGEISEESVLDAARNPFLYAIRRYGNTSAASMLIVPSEGSESARFRAGVPVVFAGFGAGFHWRALLASGM